MVVYMPSSYPLVTPQSILLSFSFFPQTSPLCPQSFSSILSSFSLHACPRPPFSLRNHIVQTRAGLLIQSHIYCPICPKPFPCPSTSSSLPRLPPVDAASVGG